MSYMYPEWVIPEGVDLHQLREELAVALTAYEAASAFYLCDYTTERRLLALYTTIRQTLTATGHYTEPYYTLEVVMNRLASEAVFELDDSQPSTEGRLRRLQWLKRLKEKLDESE